MLEATMILLELLRPYGVGHGPDGNQLIALWGENDPSALRPAIDGLEHLGLIKVYRGMATEKKAHRARYGIGDVVCVYATEAMQAYRDEPELT